MLYKKSAKNKSDISKKKYSINDTKRNKYNSKEKTRSTLHPTINPKKIITDDDELDYDEEEKKPKKLKNSNPKKNTKDDYDSYSFDSLSTNKTEEIPKARTVIKYPLPSRNRKDSSISRTPNKERKSPNKSRSKNNKSKKSVKNKKEKKTRSKSRKKSQNKNNLHIKIKNPYYTGESNDNSNEDEDSNNSDYEDEEASKNKKRKNRRSVSRNKSSKKNIEMKDYSWTRNEYDSKTSILGSNYLPCREKEQKVIYDYIQEGLQTNGNYNSLYIAGMPGTGKTVCVKTVINIIESEYYQNNKKKDKKHKRNYNFPPFTKLFICGTEYPSVTNVYKAIYNFIFSSKKGVTKQKCTHLLNKFFSNRKNYDIAHLNDPSNSHIILVIDEIDFLINKNQNLLYNIFNWTTYEESKLIVISISNTLDLPNHLTPKIKSRMGNNKLMFKPYNKDELIEIIKSKGIDYEQFTSDAIKLSSMKVAAINGDLRRIIQILTRAKEIYNLSAKKSQNKKIDKSYILKACEELFNSKLTKVIQSLQISEKIIICAILSKMKDISDNKIKVGDLFDKKDIFINKYNENIENNRNNLNIYWEEFQKIIYNLIRLQLIIFCEKPNINFMENYLTIKFYTDEFVNACNEDMKIKPVLDYLTNLIST